MFSTIFLLLSKNLFVINHHGFGILFSGYFVFILAGFILILGTGFKIAIIGDLNAEFVNRVVQSSRMSIRFR